MTPGARLLSVVEIIDSVFKNKIDNNYVIANNIKRWMRNNRYAGSKDKREIINAVYGILKRYYICLLYTSPSPRDRTRSRMPSSA